MPKNENKLTLEEEQAKTIESLKATISNSVRILTSAITSPLLSPNNIKEFLKLVVEGEQDKAEAMLKSNPALALIPGDVTDLSGREFEGITGFQYAVWALDWHMWTMIERYLHPDYARLQAQGFETGVWVRQHGVHAQYLLDNLEKAYQTTIQLSNGTKADNAWIQQVGGAQRLLPAHVINEYCHPTRKFHLEIDFNKLPFPRSRTISGGEWFTAGDGKLGEKFAVHRGNYSIGVMVDKCLGMDFHEYYSIRDLSSTRTAQREKLIIALRPARLGGNAVVFHNPIARETVENANQQIQFPRPLPISVAGRMPLNIPGRVGVTHNPILRKALAEESPVVVNNPTPPLIAVPRHIIRPPRILPRAALLLARPVTLTGPVLKPSPAANPIRPAPVPLIPAFKTLTHGHQSEQKDDTFDNIPGPENTIPQQIPPFTLNAAPTMNQIQSLVSQDEQEDLGFDNALHEREPVSSDEENPNYDGEFDESDFDCRRIHRS